VFVLSLLVRLRELQRRKEDGMLVVELLHCAKKCPERGMTYLSYWLPPRILLVPPSEIRGFCAPSASTPSWVRNKNPRYHAARISRSTRHLLSSAAHDGCQWLRLGACPRRERRRRYVGASTKLMELAGESNVLSGSSQQRMVPPIRKIEFCKR